MAPNTLQPLSTLTPEELARHVTIWNRNECRKIAGNAAPLRRNLEKYLNKHPECEVYDGQDKDPKRKHSGIDPITGEKVVTLNEHVPIWHIRDKRKVTGNAAPLRKNVENYLRKNPQCEIYNGQDKIAANSSDWPKSKSSRESKNEANSSRHQHPFTTQQNPAITKTIGPAAEIDLHSHENHTRLVFLHGKTPAWGPAPNQSDTQMVEDTPQPCPPQSSRPVPSPAPQPTYKQMVSSWSQIPGFTMNAPLSQTPGSTMPMNPYALAGSFPSHNHCVSPMDTEGNTNGIPIPGAAGRDRLDVHMLGSMGASYGGGTTPMDIQGMFGITPRSNDPDSDVIPFSPSYFFVEGSIPKSTQNGRLIPPGDDQLSSDGTQPQ